MRPIQTEKHEGTWSFLGQNASTLQTITLIQATAGEPALANEIATGSHVKWIFIEFNLNGVNNSGASQVFHWMIFKNKNNAYPAQDPTIYDASTKSNILKKSMEMLPEVPLDSGGTIQTKRVFTVKIPKIMQRFGETDSLYLYYKSTSASGINFCGIDIFREIR